MLRIHKVEEDEIKRIDGSDDDRQIRMELFLESEVSVSVCMYLCPCFCPVVWIFYYSLLVFLMQASMWSIYNICLFDIPLLFRGDKMKKQGF